MPKGPLFEIIETLMGKKGRSNESYKSTDEAGNPAKSVESH